MTNHQDLYSKWAQSTPQIRKWILQMIATAQSGHPGGSLSLVEILYSLMAEGGVMNWNPKAKLSKGEDPYPFDRLLLSKGHGVPALYAVFCDRGHEIKPEELMQLRKLGSRLQGHPDCVRFPSVQAATGSLGQGASIALGMALAYKLDKRVGQIFTIIGDGETQEGQIWEMAMSASHHQLNNLTVIIDYNKGQIDGHTNQILNLEPLADKWKAFGFDVFEVDGHYYPDLHKALSKCRQQGDLNSVGPKRPSVVIAHTIKGRGVSFMEGLIEWHGVAPNPKQLSDALSELDNQKDIGLTQSNFFKRG